MMLPDKRLPKKNLYVGLAVFIALIGLFAGYAFHLHRDLDMPIGQAIGQGILGGLKAIGTIVGAILFTIVAPFIAIYDAWFHVIPAVIFFILAIYYSMSVRIPWRTIIFTALVFLWLVYGAFCVGRYFT